MDSLLIKFGSHDDESSQVKMLLGVRLTSIIRRAGTVTYRGETPQGVVSDDGTRLCFQIGKSGDEEGGTNVYISHTDGHSTPDIVSSCGGPE